MPVYVNTVEITDDAVFKEMQFHPAKNQETARDIAARALVIKELLRQEATEQGFLDKTAIEDTVDEGIMKLIEKKVSTPDADTATCRRYYEQNKERFCVKGEDQNVAPFEQAETCIQDYLHTRSIRHGIQFYIQSLAARANIAGFDLSAAL